MGRVVEPFDRFAERVRRAQAAVDRVVVDRVVPVSSRLEDGSEIQRGHAQRSGVVEPSSERGKARHRRAGEVVAARRTEQAERVDVVEDGVRRPVSHGQVPPGAPARCLRVFSGVGAQCTDR